MSSSVDVIKRGGRRSTEAFDSAKLKRSIEAVCVSLHTPHGQASIIAESVCRNVEDWLEKHAEVTSTDIRKTATRALKLHHPDAAYLYENHKIIM